MVYLGMNLVCSGMDDLILRLLGSKFNVYIIWLLFWRIVESLLVNGFFWKYLIVNWYDVIFFMIISILGIVI